MLLMLQVDVSLSAFSFTLVHEFTLLQISERTSILHILLVNRFVDAFEGLITSKLENTIPEKIAKKIESFNSVLESFPKEVPITSLAALNITFVGDPELSDTSLKLALNGSFSAKDDNPVSKYEYLQDPSSCNSPPRMVKISVNDHVFESLLMVYFEVSLFEFIVNEI